MRKFLLALLLAVVSSVAFCNVYAADWKFTGSGPQGPMFFDANSIKYPEKDYVSVWVKGISNKAAKNYYKGKRGKELISDVSKKLTKNHVPSLMLLDSVKNKYKSDQDFGNAIFEALIDEAMANDPFGISPYVSIYFQIDCKNKRIGTLSITTYSKDGTVKSSDSSEYPNYSYFAPDTTGDLLTILVCPKI